MIPLSRPDIGPSETAAILKAAEAGWVSGTGPDVRRFEEGLAQRLDRRHVIATSSGTTALELAMRALGIGPGDEVVVPALTFAAPALTVLALGATPVLADIDEGTWTVDAAEVVAKLTPRTKAVVAVDLMGHSCDYDALADLPVPLVEDAAQAHGATYRDRPVGSFGDVSIFSFHANKTITTGEGGCVATDSDELAETMRLICNHGMTAERPYFHDVVGRNHRLSNLPAALGAVQVGRWDELVAQRNQVAARYVEALPPEAGTPRPIAEDWAGYSCWLQAVRSPRQGELVAHLRSRGCDARPIWPALSELSLINPDGQTCPVAELVSRETLWLPTASALTEEEVRAVCEAVDAFRTA